MGQPITVTARAGVNPNVRMFETNRTFTSQEIERYPSVEAAAGSAPEDVLARRLFALGATSVSVYSNVVTVEAPEAQWGAIEAQMTDAIAHLFEYYGDDAGWSPAAREAMGVTVRTPREVVPE